ncbi:RCC1 domain-containing protein [Deinococcus puniceus]|uniref:RCC1 domain-containing protein n=1 Tax=Deinococcus puniceus TaxID=1182568 RepID=UPI0018D347AE|nr:hypothetical protein [Deinococcus puniceus]
MTAQDPKDATRKAFATVQIQAASTAISTPWRTHTFVAGDGYSLAIAEDGRLWAWGRNDRKQVPGAKAIANPVPLLVEGLTNVSAVATAADANFSLMGLALTEDRNLWAWGKDRGTPAVLEKNIKYVSYGACLLVSAGDGTFSYTRGNGRLRNPLKNVTYAISVGSTNSTGYIAAIDSNGNAFISNDCDGTLKSIPAISEVVTITPLTDSSFLAQLQNGTAMRIDQKGATALAGFQDINKMSSINMLGTGGRGYVATKNGEVREFTVDKTGTPTVPRIVNGLQNIIDISVSRTHALFLDRDGRLFSIGDNTYGQLGNGSKQSTETPVSVIGVKVARP